MTMLKKVVLREISKPLKSRIDARTQRGHSFPRLSLHPRPRLSSPYGLRCQKLFSINSVQTITSIRRSSTQRIPSDLADTDLPDPTSLEKNDSIKCAYFDKTGRFVSDQQQRTKADIAEQFELRHRDLRDLDVRSESVARILVRPRTILLQFFHLCIIIQADESLLITHDQTNSPKTDEDAKQPNSDDSHRQKIYHDFERGLTGTFHLETPGLPELPYELRAVEAALDAVVRRLRTDFLATRQQATTVTQTLDLASGQAAIGLDEVFECTRRLAQVEQKARVLRDTIREVLDTDEDLAGMYLSDAVAGRPHAVADHQEAEYLLEAYHKTADVLVGSAQAMADGLRRKEAIFRSALAVQRNQIMFLEARIAIHTLGLAAGTMVAGLFGMNLVNYLEEAPLGFAWITGGSVVLSLIFSMSGLRSLWRIRSLRGLKLAGRRSRS